MKRILITGGGSGIGYATAKYFKEKGFDVTITGRNAEKLDAASKELDVRYLIADVADERFHKQAVEIFAEGLDVLVNNAGTTGIGPVASVTKRQIDEVFGTNLFGPLLLTASLIPALEKKGGCVINISSICSQLGIPGLSLYTSSKGAIESMTRVLAIELANKNIRVNTISLGSVETPMMGFPPDVINMIKNKMLTASPMKRQASAFEIAQVIYFQSESTFTTGATWVVDGGQSVFDGNKGQKQKNKYK